MAQVVTGRWEQGCLNNLGGVGSCKVMIVKVTLRLLSALACQLIVISPWAPDTSITFPPTLACRGPCGREVALTSQVW